MIVDVSVPLRADLPHWPGESALDREVMSSVEDGDSATVSRLTMGTHTGTHMDAPVHFLAGGDGIDALPLEALWGPAYVADLTDVEGAISADDLDEAGIPDGCERLLAKTRNSGWSDDTEFVEDFAAYDASAARWVVERGIKLLGIDYLSIEPFGSGRLDHPTHKTLLGAGVVIVEGVDLADIDPGEWEMVALPLPIPDGDGSPARVLLRR